MEDASYKDDDVSISKDKAIDDAERELKSEATMTCADGTSASTSASFTSRRVTIFGGQWFIVS